jgi:hypothetical protein
VDKPFNLPIEFSSDITDFVKFGDVLLVRLETGETYFSATGEAWEQFLMHSTGKIVTAPDRG